ncbi:dihydrofolate reductase [Candidatus Peregrinibacteria bacterium CG10_big_fil_rev_8_21_14_0_10_49_24]|nr:MAG: dihydrofolate reductase [Candidatus Peregrinibacteria bacterium CG11_big_fil_rev_8_21_14_0_20_49_14]PIR51638.1 MAG: dihydrofolate reductase [Candidatus Peregrinibacteria bacterium CG10_big_fil_rev_8_21_14_0_10_49_24]PJA68002.1 MAG: dihydrofolate reductase [Candidatus Peregrinibacteria bacterium CG_4_9_14_3_um_filter_49_12]
MRISLIVAASENNVIGRNNDLPWSLPDDLQHFRTVTEGSPIILGRKNYESIGRPLPRRRNIVISRQPNLSIDGCEVVASLEEALDLVKQEDEVFVIGGGEIYRQALPSADRIYLTRVHADIEGDVFFPELSEEDWEEVSREEHLADDRHAYAFTYRTLDRRK